MGVFKELYRANFKRHQELIGGRGTYISLMGIMKFYEVIPLLMIPLFSTTAEILYFSLYYPWTRTDVQYRFIPPLHERIDFYNPRVCKFKKTSEYREYKPLVDLDNLLQEMHCVEVQRKRTAEEMKRKEMEKDDKCK